MTGLAVHEVNIGFHMKKIIDLKRFCSLGSAQRVIMCAGTGVAVKQRYSY